MTTKTADAGSGTGIYANLQPGVKAALQRLIAASGGRIRINNAYRSPERQAILWQRALKKYGSAAAARKWVAPPGKSNHGKGLAADLEGDLKLAHELAPKFGLVFPMKHEAWHVELAGARSDPEAYTTPPTDDEVADADPRVRKLAMLAEMVGLPTYDDGGGESMEDGGGEPAQQGGGTLQKLARALKARESGGRVLGKQDYKAVGAKTRYGQATGAAQWLDSTWGKYKGFARAADAPPEVQEERLMADLQSLLNQYKGDVRKVAMHWHGGPDTAQWGPKTRGYADDIVALMGGD